MSRIILVTSALPYANGSIHLGHMLEYIQTDIFVRFQRLKKNKCIFVCADDAHGTAIMLKAEKLGKSPESLIADVQEEHLKDFNDFGISFDHYSTTHSAENRFLSEYFFKQLYAKSNIVKRTISQLYDPQKKMFLADRYVKGNCPKCHSPDQYGDNCENCGATYSAVDLKNPISIFSGKKPDLRKTDHFFFKLGIHSEFLKNWIRSGTLQPEITNKLEEWINEGLKDWDITRDHPYFGFLIPKYEDKYFYVWLDAPIGYMAAFQQWCNIHEFDFDSLWKDCKNTELIHFIGKDIINFHCLFWPSMLKTAGFRVPSQVRVHGFVTVNGKKMSKSRGTFIHARRYLDHLDPEYLRYYFASKLSSKVEDIDLNLNDFVAKVNSDLVGKLINIASRTARFINQYFNNCMSPEIIEIDILKNIRRDETLIVSFYETGNYSRAMKLIMEHADAVNTWIAFKQPWHIIKIHDRKLEVQLVCSIALSCFYILILYLKPVMPKLAERVEVFLRISPLDFDSVKVSLADQRIEKFHPMLSRIEKSSVEKIMQKSNKIETKMSKKVEVEKSKTCSIDDFNKIDMRVAEIIEASKVDHSDKLLRLKLDIGGQIRQVFSGIRDAYEPTSLIGRKTILVCNLLPRKMRFGLSEGMVLAAGAGGKEIYLLSPDDGAKPGDRIS